jgi:hypothetical protein
MITRSRKELYWLLGTISLTLTIGLVIFGDKLFNGRPLDLQIHDTYFIFPKILFLTVIFICLLGGMYLNRAIYNKWDNRAVSILVAILLTFIVIRLISYSDWIYGYVKDSGYYIFDERSQTERISEFTMTHWVLTIIISVTLVTIVTTGYKILKPKSVG